MQNITIRNLDERLEKRLIQRAANHDWSVEEEAWDILRSVLSADTSDNAEAGPKYGLGTALHAAFARLGGLDLPEIERQPMRQPPSFDQYG